MILQNKYEGIFLIERPSKLTIFFLTKKLVDTNLNEFMRSHNITTKILQENTNEIIDFYNDMIKFQNKKKTHLNHLTIFSYSEKTLFKYMKDKENDKNFIKWVDIGDRDWIDRIYNYFSDAKFFEQADIKK